jgi:hypothetical protein
MDIENLSLEQLKEKYKDVLNNKDLEDVCNWKNRLDTISFGDQSPQANKYAMNEEAYSEHSKETLSSFLDLYNNSQK